VEESETMSLMPSVQDTVDGSFPASVVTPSTAATPMAAPPPGQVGKQGTLKSMARFLGYVCMLNGLLVNRKGADT
jgi:hypothetical protein